MRDYNKMDYFPTQERLVEILCQKTQNQDKHFFRILTAYYFSKIASMMRVNINTHDRGSLPVNMYAINLATSGYGKGMSTNIIEEQVIDKFRSNFLDKSFEEFSQINLAKIALKRATKKGTEPENEETYVRNEFKGMGELPFSFDSGTTPAVKQLRTKLLMADAGSMNMEIDEIGSNLLGNVDVLATLLELFDVGKVKQKLIKNTAENIRTEDLEGRTPTNCMLFGTPSKLFDGGRVEEEMRSMLSAGYARRCFFGYATQPRKEDNLTPEQIYDVLTDTNSTQFIEDLSNKFYKLADVSYFHTQLDITKEVSILNIQYKSECEAYANKLPEHQEILKAEISHRYFKALKLAGVYAFIDNSPEVTEEHMYNAIKLVEDSGRALKRMLERDRNYVRIAKHIASIEKEITHVDLMEDMPCYRGSETARRELINLATAYGYKNNIIIKRNVVDGIEFLKGESLKKTDLDNMKVSYSTKMAEDYKNEEVPFKDIHKLTQQPGFHWVNHHLRDGYRNQDHVIPGCDMVVIDIDGGQDMELAKRLLNKFAFHMYTTKSHTAKDHRFRVVFPLSHRVELTGEDFKSFMDNIFAWLPFNVDEATNQRERKWLSHKGQYYDNEGEKLDALLFIPKTGKEQTFKQTLSDLSSLSNVERWFVAHTDSGSRSNNLIRYALMLVDSGMDYQSIQNNVLALNSKLDQPLQDTEILGTIMVTVGKRLGSKKNTA